MESISSPSLPPTSDPALYDDWEAHFGPAILPSSTNPDDFEALHLVQQEKIIEKNKLGEVIQHRVRMVLGGSVLRCKYGRWIKLSSKLFWGLGKRHPVESYCTLIHGILILSRLGL